MHKTQLVIGFIGVSFVSFGQSTTEGSSMLFYSVLGLCLLLAIWALLTLAGNLLKIEAHKYGIGENEASTGIFPGLKDFISAKIPAYVKSGSFHRLNKGHDILLEGEAERTTTVMHTTRYAVNPKHFHGLSPIPKVEKEVGEEVLAGDVVYYDKKNPDIKFVAPVSGEVVEVRRGEKRSVADIVILADRQLRYKKFQTPDIHSATREQLVQFMAESGLWTLINERPFDVIPSLESEPAHIFVTTFDTAPLAPDFNFIIEGHEDSFQKGLDVLAKLTSGHVHLGLDARGSQAPHKAYTEATGVQKNWFAGPHPSGNVGIQIHHTSPIVPGSVVWTVHVQDVVTIGKMFLTGEYHADRMVALTGAELKEPHYVKTYQGASIAELLKGNISDGNNRIVSGDVLSGTQVTSDDFLRAKDDMITVLKEGDHYELFGWLLPLAPRPSISGSIPSYGKDHKFEANTNTHGEKRAFVVTGEYESVLPMDIYPQHLVKAIITQNLEKMEGLGLLELSEEDVALCEFVCTSKTPVQSLVRQGLDTLKEQM